MSGANTVEKYEIYLGNSSASYPSNNFVKCGDHTGSVGESNFIVGCQGTASQVVIRGSKTDNTGATLSLCHVRVYGKYNKLIKNCYYMKLMRKETEKLDNKYNKQNNWNNKKLLHY